MSAAGTVRQADARARAAGLRVRRAWPRGPGHLQLELGPVTAAPVGPPVAAQWFADADRARHVWQGTREEEPGAVALLDGDGPGALVLQRRGADRRLPALAGLLRAPGSTLVSHRAERRAVVRREVDGTVLWTKVVRPGRAAATVRAADLATRCGGPAVVAVDHEAGLVTTSDLPGRTLHTLLPDPTAPPEVVGEAVGRAVRRLHAVPGDGLAAHDLGGEREVCARWVEQAGEHGVLAPESLDVLRAVLARDPEPAGTAAPVTLHRDLHDLQLVLARGAPPALLDLDNAARGEAALDLANLLVHLRFRARQGLVRHDVAERWCAAVLRGYAPGPAVLAGLDGYAALTWARVAAVHAFRPDDRAAVVSALQVLGQRVRAA